MTSVPYWVPIAAALGGAIAGAFLKFLFDLHVKDRRRLLLLSGKARALFPLHSEWAGKVDVVVAGTRVAELSEIDFELRNTGNRSIPDIEVKLSLSEGARFVAVEPSSQSVSAPLGIDVETLEERMSEGAISLDFLNPGERKKYRFLVDKPGTKLTAIFRQPDVTSKMIDLEEAEQASYDLALGVARLTPLSEIAFRLLLPANRRSARYLGD